MRLRSQAEIDALVEEAGFKKLINVLMNLEYLVYRLPKNQIEIRERRVCSKILNHRLAHGNGDFSV